MSKVRRAAMRQMPDKPATSCSNCGNPSKPPFGSSVSYGETVYTHVVSLPRYAKYVWSCGCTQTVDRLTGEEIWGRS